MAVVVTTGWAGPLSGKLGNAVFVRTAHGTVLRERPDGSSGKSPLQLASEARIARASRAFRELTREEGKAWSTFGQTVAEAHPRTGRVVALSGQQAFNRLATKLLQIDPQAVLPHAPPTAPFFGDGLRVTVEALSNGIAFASDAANRNGVLTELLLQPLASQHRRTYLQRYRSQAFIHFSGSSLQVAVPCGPGWYAIAVRFVEAASGRATAEIELGVLHVG